MEEFELESGEQIVRMVRTHPFVLALRLLPFALLLLLPQVVTAFLSFASTMNPEMVAVFKSFSVPSGTIRFFSGIWYLGLWTGAFTVLTRYFLTVWVITNIRIVDIKQHGFFNREVSSFLLVRVQDITTEVSGILGTLIGFGRLSVETAGNDERFTMGSISHPEQVRDIIMSQVAQLHHEEKLGSGV